MVGIVVAIVAFGLLRTIVDAWYAGVEASVVRAAHHAQRDLARVLAAAQLRAEAAPGAGRQPVAGANWFGGVYITEGNFFPQFAIERRELSSTCTPSIVLSAEERKAFLRRPPGRDRRPQARRQVRLEGRRPDPAPRHDLPGHVDVHAARHLRRRRTPRSTRRSSSSTGVPQRDASSALPAPRRPGRAVLHRDARSRRRPRRDLAARSTPRSRIRSRRR